MYEICPQKERPPPPTPPPPPISYAPGQVLDSLLVKMTHLILCVHPAGPPNQQTFLRGSPWSLLSLPMSAGVGWP